MKVIAFTKTKLPYGWFGNMSPFPIEFKGKNGELLKHCSRLSVSMLKKLEKV